MARAGSAANRSTLLLLLAQGTWQPLLLHPQAQGVPVGAGQSPRGCGSQGQVGAGGLAVVDAAPKSPSAAGPTAGRKGPRAVPCKAAVAFLPATKNPPPSPRLRNQHRVQGTWLGVWVLPASLEPAQPPLPCASVSPSAMTAGGGGGRNVTLPCVLQRGGSICYK